MAARFGYNSEAMKNRTSANDTEREIVRALSVYAYNIDSLFGRGFARDNPMFLAAVLQAVEFNSIGRRLIGIEDGLSGVGAAIDTIFRNGPVHIAYLETLANAVGAIAEVLNKSESPDV